MLNGLRVRSRYVKPSASLVIFPTNYRLEEGQEFFGKYDKGCTRRQGPERGEG
jgi:hypothetical protein